MVTALRGGCEAGGRLRVAPVMLCVGEGGGVLCRMRLGHGRSRRSGQARRDGPGESVLPISSSSEQAPTLQMMRPLNSVKLLS